MALHEVIDWAVRHRGAHKAVVEGGGQGTLTYEELDALSNKLRDRLVALGVQRGDRVGIYLRKSADGVASIFGILKAGAAYVPVDPTAPATRNAYIHNNCAVKAVIIERRFVEAYARELERLGPLPAFIVLNEVGGGAFLRETLDTLDGQGPAAPASTVKAAPNDLAYILYTSGSTGKPKGVMLSHENATSFVGWCSQTFQPRESDVFSSHAPFHFDLSILDIYVPLKHGATLVLIPEDIGKEPQGLAALIAERGITCWYSAPSTLSLLAQFGRLDQHDLSALRLVLFAGEVFPVVHLRSLIQQLPEPRYFNLYGPTETNVCTYYEIPKPVPPDRVDPYPIGRVCENLEGVVVDSSGKPVPESDEGELCIAGPNVMQGYWGMAEQTAASFLPDDGSGRRWYKTGDIVKRDEDGELRYVGRRDRMVKRRGYRIELGEIEACLYQHAAVREVAVVALHSETGVEIKAHLSVNGERRPSMVELKTFCSRHLPVYMVPDSFAFHERLARTSTDKIDYQTLIALS